MQIVGSVEPLAGTHAASAVVAGARVDAACLSASQFVCPPPQHQRKAKRVVCDMMPCGPYGVTELSFSKLHGLVSVGGLHVHVMGEFNNG